MTSIDETGVEVEVEVSPENGQNFLPADLLEVRNFLQKIIRKNVNFKPFFLYSTENKNKINKRKT